MIAGRAPRASQPEKTGFVFLEHAVSEACALSPDVADSTADPSRSHRGRLRRRS